MQFSRGPYYLEDPVDREPGEEPRANRRSGVSKTFAFSLAAIAILLGFTLGLLSDSFGGPVGGRASLYDEAMITELFESASPAVVEITVSRTNPTIPLSELGTGSGFLIDGDGHILTNSHVVEGAEEISINLGDGRTLTATKLGTSPADDLALLQVDPQEVRDITPLVLADSDEVRPGQLAVAIGSPFRNFNSITVGVVSGTGRGPVSELRRPIPDMIQTDAPLNPGNSGGPLLNSDGLVIGVNSAVRTPTFSGLGDFRIGFAVPSNTVRALMPELLTPGEVKRPWLGISGGPISRQLADSLGISKGVVVTQVFPSSPASAAGLVPFRSLTSRGDVITGVDGIAVGSVEEMVSYFNSKRPGEVVVLSIFRENEDITVEIVLAEWPDT
ncbi:MAG: trypsin-like peptidase domain-containing protein [Chloroflexi bacterium]|nr:trypsin-like peptidase domain-containing protein [Chloroflexota bacterium]